MRTNRCFLILLIFFISISIHAQTWQELYDSTNTYMERGDYRTALVCGETALAKAEKEFGKLDTNYAKNLYIISVLWYYTGDLDSAIVYGKKTMDLFRRVYKTDHPDLASSINSMGAFFRASGDYEKAEPFYIEALEMFRRMYKTDHPNLATSISNTALFYLDVGDNTKAELLSNEALEMKRRIYKTDHPDLAIGIDNTANFYEAIGEYTKAESLYKEALEMFRRIYKTDHPDLIICIDNLADFYKAIGDNTKAEPLCIEALEMKRRIYKTDHPDLAISINKMGFFYRNKGDYEKAEPLYKEALEMFRRIYKTDHPDLAISIDNLADFYSKTGNYTKAGPLFKEALEMFRRIYTTDHPDLAISIDNTAGYYASIGDYTKAEPLYKESLEMKRRIYTTDHPRLATSINNTALFYLDVGDNTKAELLFKEALEMRRRLFKTDHLALAVSIDNIAGLYKAIGDNTKAELLFKEALGMFRRLYKTDHPDLALSISNMGFFYMGTGDYEKAEPLYKEALEMFRRLYKSDHPDLALSINNMGYFYMATGDYEKAEPFYKEALEMYRRIYKSDHPDLALSINNLGFIYKTTGNYKKAEPLYIEAIDMYKNIYYNQSIYLSEIEKKKFWNTISRIYDGFISFTFFRAEDNPAIISQMYDLQLYTKAVLFNTTNKVRRRILNSNDNTLITKYKEWSDKKEFLAKLYSMPEDKVKRKGFDIDSIKNLTNDLEKELTLKSEDFKQAYEKKKITWRSIQESLQPDEAAVELIRFRKRGKVPNKYNPDVMIEGFTDTVCYAAMIVKPPLKKVGLELVLLENGNELEEKYIMQYHKLVNSQIKGLYDPIELEESLKGLYKQFWQKIQDKLQGVNTVYLSHDGVYNLINLNTLINSETDKYLLEEIDLRIVTNTRDIIERKYTPLPKGENNIAVLFGDPQFDLDSTRHYELASLYIPNITRDYYYFSEETDSLSRGSIMPLPGTRGEVETISIYMEGKNWTVKKYLGSEAMEEVIKTTNNPKVLHIATHGRFLNDVEKPGMDLLGFEKEHFIENPLLRSFLLFAGAKNSISNPNRNAEDVEDGLLTAYEAQNLNLDKTELVVLSACNTGLGEIRNGEGVYGLQRAFLVAGAKTIIMSLWPVRDDATKKLMTGFYEKWLGGISKRQAFREAQMEIKKKNPDFYYWGGFVMIGE